MDASREFYATITFIYAKNWTLSKQFFTRGTWGKFPFPFPLRKRIRLLRHAQWQSAVRMRIDGLPPALWGIRQLIIALSFSKSLTKEEGGRGGEKHTHTKSINDVGISKVYINTISMSRRVCVRVCVGKMSGKWSAWLTTATGQLVPIVVVVVVASVVQHDEWLRLGKRGRGGGRLPGKHCWQAASTWLWLGSRCVCVMCIFVCVAYSYCCSVSLALAFTISLSFS